MPAHRLAAVARLTSTLGRATTLAEVYDCALDALLDGVGVERASVLLFDEAGVMSFVAWRGISDRYRRAVHGHTPWTPDTRGAAPIGVHDVHADPSLESYRPVFDAESIRALGFFPLISRDRVIGKFMLYYREPHTLTEDEVQLAETIAGQIAFGVARIRAELELKNERDRLADLVANAPGVVWERVIEADGSSRSTFISDQIVELLGYPIEAWKEPGFHEKVIVEGPLEGATGITQYLMRRADGRVIAAEVRIAQKKYGDREIWRGMTLDVTARRNAERNAAFLAQATKVLSASIDYDVTLEQLAQLSVRELADWCTIDLLEDGEIRRVAGTHRDADAKQNAIRSIRSVDASQQRSGTILRVIEAGQPVLVREFDWDAFRTNYSDAPEIVETFEQLGIASFMCVPLIARNQCVGAMTLVAVDRLFEEADLQLAKELANRAAYAIDNARLYREAQEANRAKDEFLVTLSHELRTPMTATLGWASMLRGQDIPPDTFRLAIDTIVRSTHAQAKLIDGILDVSRIVSGKLQLTMAPLNVRNVVDAAIDAIRPTVAAKQLELYLSLTEFPAIAVADASRLQQVLWNLLSNAVKFTPVGGSMWVTLDNPADEHVQITVRDSGVGIPRKFLPHVFERFRQADSSTSRKHDGLGLGLAIVKSITELHGGRIEVDSEGEGRGATFTLTLPLAPPVSMTAMVTHEAAPLALSGVSVLLVEDEDDTRYMLSAALQSFGARVTAVRSVAAAVDSMHAAMPSVVVSDIGMAGEDGYGLMMRIRSSDNERVRGLPAIALTAYAAPEDRTRVLNSGFNYHLAKPVDPLLVVQTVREAAGR
ncbi:MAG TPA: ATP-binding protein [Thermoanaerobaculia bacterium]|nr:ATP-binding protein [Thermoanaerobaculia bacterium]